MANTSIRALSTITGANVDGANDRFIVHDFSANVDLAITGSELKNIIGNITTTPMIFTGTNASDAVRITQTGAGNALVVEDSTNPDATPFVVNNSGVVVTGHTAALSTIRNYVNATTAITPSIQLHGVTTAAATVSAAAWGSGTTAPAQLVLAKSKGTTVGSYTAGASGDDLGAVVFNGTDGTQFVTSAVILTEIDGTPSANNVPGRMMFQTMNGAGLSEVMRITANTTVGIGTTVPANKLHVTIPAAANNAVSYPLRIESQTVTAPTIGIGTGIEFATETATSNNLEIGARIESVSTNITSAAENFDLVFKTMAAGATAAERFRISSAGNATLTGDLAVNGGDITTSSTTFNMVTGTATTVNAWNAATALTIGYTGTATGTTTIAGGATTTGATKTLNIGTSGAAGSTTNINIGSASGGTVVIAPLLDLSATANTATAATQYWVATNDGKVRPKTLANVKTEIVTTAAVNTAAATTLGTVTTGVWNAGAVTSSGAVTAATNLTATAGSVTAGTTVSAGTTVTAGTNVAATAGSVTAGTYVTTGITAAYTNIATTAALNFTTKAVQKVTPTAAVTVTATVPPAGTVASIIVLTSGVTSYTITFSTGFLTATTTLATGTVTGKYFVINYLSDGTQLIETSRTVAI